MVEETVEPYFRVSEHGCGSVDFSVKRGGGIAAFSSDIAVAEICDGRPDLVIISLGGNDADGQSSSYRHEVIPAGRALCSGGSEASWHLSSGRKTEMAQYIYGVWCQSRLRHIFFPESRMY